MKFLEFKENADCFVGSILQLLPLLSDGADGVSASAVLRDVGSQPLTSLSHPIMYRNHLYMFYVEAKGLVASKACVRG